MTTFRCPDCGEMMSVPEGAKSGDLVECPNCAGHALRLRWDGRRWAATLAYRVSCPSCDDVLTLPDDVKAGDTIECCGHRYQLTFEYGAFAAEKPLEVPMWRDCCVAVDIIGAVVSCLACLTASAVITLRAIGLGAWTVQLDAVVLPALAGYVGLVAYCYSIGQRRTP